MYQQQNQSGDLSRPKLPPPFLQPFPQPFVPDSGHMPAYTYNSSPQCQVGHSRLGLPPPLPLPPRQFPLRATFPIPTPISDYARVPRQAFGCSHYQPSTGDVNNSEQPLFSHTPSHSAPAPDSSPLLTSVPRFATMGHPSGREPSYLSHSQSSGAQYAMSADARPSSYPPPHLPALPLPDRIVHSASSRVGQKKALLVGIDYSRHRDRRLRLNWGVYDAKEMARFLREHQDFHPNNIRILTDDQRRNLPNQTNILVAMRWLVEGAQPGDSLFFYFSGHATQIKDKDGDELDGFDECLCAMDFDDRKDPPSGIVADDSIHHIMVRPLPQGCRLTAILDCCHSGTLLDLPYIYDSHGVLKQIRPDIVQLKRSDAEVISLSTYKDSGGTFEAHGRGSLREAFIMYMVRSGNRGTYLDVIQSLHAHMASRGLTERPQLSSSHWIDTNQQFIIT